MRESMGSSLQGGTRSPRIARPHADRIVGRDAEQAASLRPEEVRELVENGLAQNLELLA